jgi:2-keto-4-pentenoate hydratase
MRRSVRQASSAARYLARCRLAESQQVVSANGALWPATVSEAYRTQAELHEILLQRGGHRVVGSKVGCTTPVMQAYLGVPHPCAGAIYDTSLWASNGAQCIEVPASRCMRLGLECEIAVRLGEKIAPGELDLERAASAVESVSPAVELVDYRYEDFEARRPGVWAWVADDFFHAGSVLGPPMEGVEARALDALCGSMHVDGACVGEGMGADIIEGHPLRALCWLADSPVAHAMGGLPAGWVVSLGSVCKTVWVRPAERTHVRVDFSDNAGAGGSLELLLKGPGRDGRVT